MHDAVVTASCHSVQLIYARTLPYYHDATCAIGSISTGCNFSNDFFATFGRSEGEALFASLTLLGWNWVNQCSLNWIQMKYLPSKLQQLWA